MAAMQAGNEEVYADLESRGLLGLVLRGRANVSGYLFVELLCSPLILGIALISAVLAFLLEWEEVLRSTTTTTTTTTNPAIVVAPWISDPDLQGMGVTFAGTLGACVLGGLLGSFLWALDSKCRRADGLSEGAALAPPADAGQATGGADDETGGEASQGNSEPLLNVGGAFGETAAFPELPVHEQFLLRAEACPSALVATFGDRRLTYAELQAAAAAAGEVLQEAGVRGGLLVALHLPGGPVAVVAILGTWIAGGAWVPIDWEAPAQRVSSLLAEVRPAAVVCSDPAPFQDVPGRLLAAEAGGLRLRLMPSLDVERPLGGGPPGSDRTAQVVFTSGSTGAPKGVIFSHRRVAFACHFFGQHCGVGAGTVVLQKTPYIWAVFRHEVFPAICRGGSLAIAAQQQRKDPRQLAQLVRDHAVEVLVATPSVLELVADALGGPAPSLRTAVCMGEGLQREVARGILERSGGRLQLHNFYGSTETENAVFSVPRLGDGAWEALTGRYLPAGRPQPNLSVHVLDPETLRPRPAGSAGEICFGGVLSDGYWQRPELTAQRFVEHPLYGRLYRTGDMGVWDQPFGLRVTGRTDRQVKIRGIRVELEEVEALLLEAVKAGGGSESAAVAAPAPGSSLGAGEDGEHLALVAFAAGSSTGAGRPLLASDVRRECQARMPPYMVPSVIQTLDALPRLPNQKVDLKALAGMAETAKETVQALDSLGMLRVLSRAQLEEDVWIQNQQAFWMLVVMLGHFQLNEGAAQSAGIDCGNLAWRIEMLLGHGKDMVAFILMVGFTDSRDAICFGPRDWVLTILTLLMSGPLQYVLSPGYGPLAAVFSPPGGIVSIQHGWFLYSFMFARLVLNVMHRWKVRPAMQVALMFSLSMLLPDDVWNPLPEEWRTWLWWNDAAMRYKGFRWSFLFMTACYLLGFHAGPSAVRWARRHAPAAGWQVAVLIGTCWTGFLAMSALNAPSPLLPVGYSTFQAVYDETLSSHLITLHYMTHPSFSVYAALWLGELLLFMMPPLFVAAAMAYCPVHFKTMGTTSLGNYVLHPTYIGAPWTKWVQAPVLSRITSPSLGAVPNIVIAFLWNVAFCVLFAMTASAAFHRGLVSLFGGLKRLLDAARAWHRKAVLT